jgi:predicted TIM-barrel fold metal-dependent hydrolase
MDADGIDVAVLYPTAMLTWIEEADIYGAACRAYNDWLHDYCAVAPDRLFPVALVPLQDPDAAIAEMERATEHLGAKAVMIRPAPYIGTLKLDHPLYDRFWSAAASIDLRPRGPSTDSERSVPHPACGARRGCCS